MCNLPNCTCNENTVNPTVKQKFPVNIGDSLIIDVIVYSQTDLQQLMDITGCDLTFTAKDDLISPTVTLVKTIGSGIVVMDALNGYARVTIDPVDTQILGKFGGVLYFDVKMLDTDSNLFTVGQGSLLLSPDVG